MCVWIVLRRVCFQKDAELSPASQASSLYFKLAQKQPTLTKPALTKPALAIPALNQPAPQPTPHPAQQPHLPHHPVASAQPIVLEKPVLVPTRSSRLSSMDPNSPPDPSSGTTLHRFACPYCYKTFSSTSNLRPHIDWHEDRKKYVCPVCGRGYRYNKDLKSHIMHNH